MKTMLMGIAFAIGMVFASQAFVTWQNGRYVSASFDERDG
jgi:DNA-binding transcriptional regulator of glucitol operon